MVLGLPLLSSTFLAVRLLALVLSLSPLSLSLLCRLILVRLVSVSLAELLAVCLLLDSRLRDFVGSVLPTSCASLRWLLAVSHYLGLDSNRIESTWVVISKANLDLDLHLNLA